MKHIKLFEQHPQYESFTGGSTEYGEFLEPNVSFCESAKHLHWTKKPTYLNEYLTFDIVSAGTITWTSVGNITRTIQYSIDEGQTWATLTSSSSGNGFPVTPGQRVMLKGINSGYATGEQIFCCLRGSTAYFNVHGNIMSMIGGDDFKDLRTISSSYAFTFFFDYAHVISARNLILPATSLSPFCYCGLFRYCGQLVTPPAKLPAKRLMNNCYQNMFRMCISLKTTPELCFETVADGVCNSMFRDCTSLTRAYRILKPTTLDSNCYLRMFGECPNLVASPILPASTLKANSYQLMFANCTNLKQITCLATNISAGSCTTDWTSGVTSSGTFVKSPSMTNWSTGVNGIPSRWKTKNFALNL